MFDIRLEALHGLLVKILSRQQCSTDEALLRPFHGNYLMYDVLHKSLQGACAIVC